MAKQYWTNKFHTPAGAVDNLDSLAMEQAFSKITTGHRQWVTKHITGHFSHRKNMVQRGHRSFAQCRCCQANLEDKIHILKYPAPSAQTQWEIRITKLNKWLKEQGTNLILQQMLIGYLQQWATNKTPRQTANSFVEEQQKIGWDRMLDRWLTQRWRDHQEQIWKIGKSQISSLRWTAALIQKLWKVSWDMWDHRNKELHASTEQQQQILHSLVNKQIKKLYAGGAQQLPRDALKFLCTPKEVVMQYLLAPKQLWVESVTTAQQRQKVHDYGKYLSKQQFMITWLNTARNNSTPPQAQPD